MDQPAEAPRPAADWARAADGIQLAGIAVFLLLNTTGVLPWSFWVDALALWPVLIMSAGVKIAFEKTRAPWLLLAGPALVLGSLAWVAGGSRLDAASGPWQPQHAAREPHTTGLELAGELFAARLQLTASPELPASTLFDGRSLARDERARIDTSTKDGRTQISVRSGRHRGFFLLPGRKQRWQLQVPADLPTRIALKGVMVRSELDLSRGRVESGRVDGVFQALDLDLPATDKPVVLKLHGVFNLLAVTVPEGTPVLVGGAGFPFNVVKRTLPGVPGRPGYEIDLEGIFTAVSLDTRPGAVPAARPPKPEAEPGGAPPAPAQQR